MNPKLHRFLMSSIQEKLNRNTNTDFDDPTSIGFSIVFDTSSPLFNLSDTGESAFAYLLAIGENDRAAKLKKSIEIFMQ